MITAKEACEKARDYHSDFKEKVSNSIALSNIYQRIKSEAEKGKFHTYQDIQIEDKEDEKLCKAISNILKEQGFGVRTENLNGNKRMTISWVDPEKGV